MIKTRLTGPVMMDIAGTELTPEDKQLLAHPNVGGLILFSRNYQSPQQVSELCQQIRLAAQAPILLAVDHEGGRVQRFREQFSAIPAMGDIYSLAGNKIAVAEQLAFHCGVLIALEMQSVGIDISFAPVLDINGISDVIGDRAFSAEPQQVEILAKSLILGMNKAGMAATGKHFPGHGSVKADSHIAAAIDGRNKSEIFGSDIKPFQQLIEADLLSAMMPAHVIYSDVDQHSVGFSRYWLQEILRKQLGFNGVIFSDDLSMEGAAGIGGYVERTEAAQQAGCDMLLVCNNRAGLIEVLDNANLSVEQASSQRIQKLLASNQVSYDKLVQTPRWQEAKQILNQFC